MPKDWIASLMRFLYTYFFIYTFAQSSVVDPDLEIDTKGSIFYSNPDLDPQFDVLDQIRGSEPGIGLEP
jgi:hypothetical protein